MTLGPLFFKKVPFSATVGHFFTSKNDPRSLFYGCHYSSLHWPLRNFAYNSKWSSFVPVISLVPLVRKINNFWTIIIENKYIQCIKVGCVRYNARFMGKQTFYMFLSLSVTQQPCIIKNLPQKLLLNTSRSKHMLIR